MILTNKQKEKEIDKQIGPGGRNQHSARRGKILLDCHPDVGLRVK